MIACDTCSEWFHGSCVGVSTKKGKEIEDNGHEWTCPKCEYNSTLLYLPNEGKNCSVCTKKDFIGLIFIYCNIYLFKSE